MEAEQINAGSLESLYYFVVLRLRVEMHITRSAVYTHVKFPCSLALIMWSPQREYAEHYLTVHYVVF